MMKHPDYLHLAAKYILRLHRYYQETFPWVIVIPAAGFIVGLLATGVQMDSHATSLTFWQFMGRVAVLSSKIIFVVKIVVYALWEGYNGCIALKNWATHYHYAKKEKD